MSQVSNIFRLSFRDYIHEWRMSGCFVFALAAVLAPMMILFGLKFGIVSSMVYELVENPANREIRAIGSGRYDQQWIETYRDRGDVEFIVPKTRALAASIQLKRRPTYGSAVGEVVLATVIIPAATAAGKMVYKKFQGVDVEPGDQLVYEVSSAATSGAALYDQRSDNDPEAPAEQSDAIESA